MACRLERGLRFFGIAVIVASLTIVGTVLAVDVPGTVWTWGLVVVLLGVLMIAPVIILVFAAMLREALGLPAQFRSLPDVAPSRARELAELARDARQHQHEDVGSIPRDTWRAGRLLNALRKELPGVSVLLSIARVPFMILVGIALLVGCVQLMMAPFLVALAVLRTLI